MFSSLTLLHKNAAFPQALTALLVQHGIHVQPRQLAATKACHVWQWVFKTPLAMTLRHSIAQLLAPAQQQGLADYVLYEGQQAPSIKLAVFDMDSTLIQAEVMDELAYAAGIGEQVAAITASAMRGEIGFQESFKRRLGLLKGFDCSDLAAIYEQIELMPGAERLMRNLLKQGVYCVILSGGFSYFADRFAARLGMQEAHSNPLQQVENKLTGDISVPILDAERKRQLLTAIRTQYGWQSEQTLAVGDGANDLPMLAAAGLGMAFHAKPLVIEQAPHHISHFGLDSLLYVLGMADTDLV
ncbi:MAG: phosphoserine phosphatase SerB [Gammaproteobacteria bacterium]|jgi:phosphoserine phosphatase|nr:phosphoserine phosphatase SerB [Gammaproteobacteria bacterium]